MKAITLWRPWPWAIFHAECNPKRIENRDWRPPAWLIGQRLAIHAGRRFQTDACGFIDNIVGNGCCPCEGREHPVGIIGTVRVVGWVDRTWIGGVLDDLGDFAPAWAKAAAMSPWFVGRFGWVLDEVITLATPIACSGAQGLWDVPSSSAVALNQALAMRGQA